MPTYRPQLKYSAYYSQWNGKNKTHKHPRWDYSCSILIHKIMKIPCYFPIKQMSQLFGYIL